MTICHGEHLCISQGVQTKLIIACLISNNKEDQFKMFRTPSLLIASKYKKLINKDSNKFALVYINN